MCAPEVLVPSAIVGQNGPLLMGYLFSYLLQGMLIVQVFIFCSQPTYTTDGLPIKVTVWTVFCLEIVSTAFTTVSAWYGLASGWGNLRALTNPSWAFAYTAALHGIISLTVQLFFCWRMTLLGSGIIVPGLIAVVCLMQSSMAIASGVKIWELPTLDAIYGITPFISVWLAGSAFCDIMIAINMVYLLYKAGRESYFKTTYHLLLRPVIICVETGTMTACSSIMHLVLFLGIRTNNAHFTFLFLTAKLYSNTLLATLVLRKTRRENTSASVFHGQTRSNSSNQKGLSSWEVELNRIPPSRLSPRTPAAVFITTQ